MPTHAYSSPSRTTLTLTLRPGPTNQNRVGVEEHREPNWIAAGDAARRVIRCIGGDVL